ncbi:MAG TPA: hypothetical protein VJT67_09875 [Longimicrobiaceae bacterium]|nr:hypothetical protein [Longimicrobiaceae bacterium]
MEILGAEREDPAGGEPRPGYVVWVSQFHNPARISLDAWVDSVYRARYDESEDSTAFDQPSPPDSIRVGGQRALRLQPFCGDCEPYEVYLARGDQVVVLSWIYDPAYLGGSRDEQKRINERILRSFRWDP